MKLSEKRPKHTALSYVIAGLIPYTKANLQLTFKPSAFFRSLDQIGASNTTQLQRAYYRAKKSGIIRYENGVFTIDPVYLAKAQHQNAKPLPAGQTMLVLYDIPEQYAAKRRQLRDLLRQLDFLQIQKSVWQTHIDFLEPVMGMIAKLELKPYVVIFVGTTTLDQCMLSPQ